MFEFIYLGLVVLVIVISVKSTINKKNEERVYKQRVDSLHNQHLATLDKIEDRFIDIFNENNELVISAYRNTVSVNNFGTKDYRRFKKELLEFVNERLSYQEKAAFDYFEKNVRRDILSDLCQSLLLLMEKTWLTELTSSVDERSMSPVDYENFCVRKFTELGWNAVATRRTGDQGVDVIATHRRNPSAGGVYKIVAQCKRYAKPVGNSAVQEIHAGLAYYNADLAIVIAPNGFTPSASQLAKATNVILLHHDDLPQAIRRLAF